MANVKFLRGLHANLPTGENIVDGSFYVTTDSHRLYIGRVETVSGSTVRKLDLLSQAVEIYANTAALPATGTPGQFYYIQADNLFVVWTLDPDTSAYGYRQVNPDTMITESALNVASVTNGASVTNVLKDNHTGTVTSNAVDFLGSGDATVTADGTNKKITVHAAQYTVGKSDTEVTGQTGSIAEREIFLKADATKVASDGGFVIKAGDNIHMSDDNGKLVISGAGAGEVAALKSATFGNLSEGFKLDVTDMSDKTVTADNLNPQITVGSVSAKQETKKFVNGVAALPVYTVSEIDAKLQGLNAMRYVGVATVAPKVADNISIGDTWKVGVDELVVPTGASSTGTAHEGDLIIARGTESTSTGYITSDLVFDIIASGDDVDTLVAFKALASGVGVTLYETNGAAADKGSLEIKGGIASGKASAGDWIAVKDTGSSGANQKAVIEHKLLESTDHNVVVSSDNTKNKEVSRDSQTFTALTSLVVDQAGHTSEIKTSTFTVTDTVLKSDGSSLATTLANSNNVVTITDTMTLVDSSSGTLVKTGAYKLTSNTLSLSVASDTITADLVWGSF